MQEVGGGPHSVVLGEEGDGEVLGRVSVRHVGGDRDQDVELVLDGRQVVDHHLSTDQPVVHPLVAEALVGKVVASPSRAPVRPGVACARIESLCVHIVVEENADRGGGDALGG